MEGVPAQAVEPLEEVLTSEIDIEEHPVKLESEEDQPDCLPGQCRDVSKPKNHPGNEDVKCDQCAILYNCSEMLVWHFEHCHGANPIVNVITIDKMQHIYECVRCKNWFRDVRKLIQHLRSQHQLQNLPFRCNVCGKQFLRNSKLKDHQLICRKNKTAKKVILFNLKCEQCDFAYARPEMLAWHTENFHGPNATINIIRVDDKHRHFQCVLCQNEFKKSHLIIRHLKNQHKISKMPYRCNICGTSFVCRSYCESHQLTCDGVYGPAQDKCLFKFSVQYGLKCSTCNEVFHSEQHKKEHFSSLHAKQRELIKCGFCDETFRFFSRFKSHCQGAHPGKPFLQCDVCKIEFSSFDWYRKHIKCHHSGLVYTCKSCPATFSYLHSLKKHMSNVHSLMPMSCKFCSANFKCAKYLHQHVLEVHSGPIIHCDHCEYSTRRKGSLMKHLRRYHF